MTAGVLLLAAGGSTRLGRAKQLLPYGGTTLLRRAAETALASRCWPVFVVLGAQADLSRREVADLPVKIVVNERWQDGIGGSIAAGIESLAGDAALDAAAIMLCDQPGVTAEHIDRLIDRLHVGGAEIVASEYAGEGGVPALFARSLFPELCALDPSRGAKSLIAKYADRVALVPFPAGEIDIDTPDDYARLSE